MQAYACVYTISFNIHNKVEAIKFIIILYPFSHRHVEGRRRDIYHFCYQTDTPVHVCSKTTYLSPLGGSLSGDLNLVHPFCTCTKDEIYSTKYSHGLKLKKLPFYCLSPKPRTVLQRMFSSPQHSLKGHTGRGKVVLHRIQRSAETHQMDAHPWRKREEREFTLCSSQMVMGI